MSHESFGDTMVTASQENAMQMLLASEDLSLDLSSGSVPASNPSNTPSQASGRSLFGNLAAEGVEHPSPGLSPDPSGARRRAPALAALLSDSEAEEEDGDGGDDDDGKHNHALCTQDPGLFGTQWLQTSPIPGSVDGAGNSPPAENDEPARRAVDSDSESDAEPQANSRASSNAPIFLLGNGESLVCEEIPHTLICAEYKDLLRSQTERQQHQPVGDSQYLDDEKDSRDGVASAPLPKEKGREAKKGSVAFSDDVVLERDKAPWPVHLEEIFVHEEDSPSLASDHENDTDKADLETAPRLRPDTRPAPCSTSPQGPANLTPAAAMAILEAQSRLKPLPTPRSHARPAVPPFAISDTPNLFDDPTPSQARKRKFDADATGAGLGSPPKKLKLLAPPSAATSPPATARTPKNTSLPSPMPLPLPLPAPPPPLQRTLHAPDAGTPARKIPRSPLAAQASLTSFQPQPQPQPQPQTPSGRRVDEPSLDHADVCDEDDKLTQTGGGASGVTCSSAPSSDSVITPGQHPDEAGIPAMIAAAPPQQLSTEQDRRNFVQQYFAGLF